ncbi:MAG: right-handed parallel beta-helix repeat-containing protein [Planctomycetota bacterium]|jgi:hypothetical protein
MVHRSIGGVVCVLGLAEAAIGNTINVPADQPTIQAAIVAAVGGDEIVVAPGTYPEKIDLQGKAITVRSSGGPAVTTIDASGLSDSVVLCVNTEGPDTVLDGFTLTGGTGSFLGGFKISEGGGMYINGASPVVRNCWFTDNTAGWGGGIECTNSSATVTNCMFIGNSVSDWGGAACMYIAGGSQFTNCVFTGNTALRGGAIAQGAQNPVGTLVNCTISGNTATETAGAIYIFDATGTLSLSNCAVWGNTPVGPGLAGGSLTVSSSDAEGSGGSGAWNGTYGVDGGGNIDADPLFVDADGADDMIGTIDDDVRLGALSPCTDAGDNTALPADVADLDDDGDTAEELPRDLDGNPRRLDDPFVADTGIGTAPFVDIGALESEGGQIQINEIRTNHNGPDVDEYFELLGGVGASLDGLTYIVIGDDPDGIGGSGWVEAVIDLTGLALDGEGFFLAAEATFTLGVADLTTDLNFENNDNVTHVLVSDFTGALNDDLDLDNDGILDVTPWTVVLDAVSIIDPNPGNHFYFEQLGGAGIGPQGPFSPGHVFRCIPDASVCGDLGGPWALGVFNQQHVVFTTDTPGACNLVCAPDADEDGFPDGIDNCPDDFNSSQADCDADGIGDLCAILQGISVDDNGNGVPDNCEEVEFTDPVEVPAAGEPTINDRGDFDNDGDEDVVISPATATARSPSPATSPASTSRRRSAPASCSRPDRGPARPAARSS